MTVVNAFVGFLKIDVGVGILIYLLRDIMQTVWSSTSGQLIQYLQVFDVSK